MDIVADWCAGDPNSFEPNRPQEMEMILQFLFAMMAASGGGDQAAPATPSREPLRLVVVVVIDQFPAYLLPRFERHFAPRGFRMLMDHGAWFQQAHYPQAATLTGVGHATVATGGLAAGHGIAGNDWFDRERDREVYCVEDEKYTWVGGKGKPDDGTSPRNMTSTTFSDEWCLATEMRPRVVAISLKDRGSILLAGQLGKAFWYDAGTGSFVSSTYYYPDGKLPAWVEQFNAARPTHRFFQQSWDLVAKREAYSAIADDRACEIEPKGLGRTFPHVLGNGLDQPNGDFYKLIATTPQGNQITLDLARAAFEAEQLGRRGVTDMLLLSLTSNDYVGHNFGPESLEYQDITLQTDRQLDSFFADLDRTIGLKHTLIALTSDHGVAPAPEHSKELGLPVGRIDPDEIAREADAALDRAFGDDDWSAMFRNPGLFLRAEPSRKRKLPRSDVEQVAAQAIRRIPGVADVFTRSQLAAGQLPETAIARSVAATFHSERSPDVIIVQQPYWYLYKDVKKNAGMHGSPFPYDTHVPVLLHGPEIQPGRYRRRVSPADIAPTICHILGIAEPSACEGSILDEAISRR
jgi:predicted AlkP superfamily pyrophosphatase or phosphodiesterase